MSRLSRKFFAEDTVGVARNLLGARLVRQLDGERLVGMVVECEAYVGAADSACHASRGLTPRNEVMFGPPGYAYVYFTYGMHWMLNIVTREEGFPAAVLFRAVQPLEGLATMYRLREAKGTVRSERDLTSGPARLTQAMAIDKSLNGTDMVDGNLLWLEQGRPVPEDLVMSGPRVGIQYADPADVGLAWRFWMRHNSYVSRAR